MPRSRAGPETASKKKKRDAYRAKSGRKRRPNDLLRKKRFYVKDPSDKGALRGRGKGREGKEVFAFNRHSKILRRRPHLGGREDGNDAETSREGPATDRKKGGEEGERRAYGYDVI